MYTVMDILSYIMASKAVINGYIFDSLSSDEYKDNSWQQKVTTELLQLNII